MASIHWGFCWHMWAFFLMEVLWRISRSEKWTKCNWPYNLSRRPHYTRGTSFARRSQSKIVFPRRFLNSLIHSYGASNAFAVRSLYPEPWFILHNTKKRWYSGPRQCWNSFSALSQKQPARNDNDGIHPSLIVFLFRFVIIHLMPWRGSKKYNSTFDE